MLRGMDVSVVHIMPWLMERQLDDTAGKLLQKSLEERGIKFLIGAQTEALFGRRARPRACGALQGRHRDRRRPGGDGRRHPPEHRAGRIVRAALRAAQARRHRRQRHDADHHRPARLRGRRMRRAPRHRLRPGGAAVRAGQGLRDAPGAVRHRPLPGQPDQHQAEGHRHRPVLGRQLRRRRRLRGDRAQRPLRRRLQEAGDPGRQAGRRLPVRRHRRRQLVLQAAARGPQPSATSATS